VTNPFYSSEETERSRAVLDEVLAAVPSAVLIDGWGTWVRTGGPMSHDIDIIVDHNALHRLEMIADDLSESHHLSGTKWRATWRSIHLDLYVPYQSRLGANLDLKVEKLLDHVEIHDEYRVLSIPAHTATKIAALLDRPDSLPGRKDRQEILQLLEEPTVESTPAVIAQASARDPEQRAALLSRAFTFLTGDPTLRQRDRERLRRTEALWQRTLSGDLEQKPQRSRDTGFDLGR
jgi:hypothetical protein